jgi:hypothetical protein
VCDMKVGSVELDWSFQILMAWQRQSRVGRHTSSGGTDRPTPGFSVFDNHARVGEMALGGLPPHHFIGLSSRLGASKHWRREADVHYWPAPLSSKGNWKAELHRNSLRRLFLLHPCPVLPLRACASVPFCCIPTDQRTVTAVAFHFFHSFLPLALSIPSPLQSLLDARR